MRSSNDETSWVELTLKLCDQVLEKTARANPANVLLQDLKENNDQVA